MPSLEWNCKLYTKTQPLLSVAQALSSRLTPSGTWNHFNHSEQLLTQDCLYLVENLSAAKISAEHLCHEPLLQQGTNLL